MHCTSLQVPKDDHFRALLSATSKQGPNGCHGTETLKHEVDQWPSLLPHRLEASDSIMRGKTDALVEGNTHLPSQISCVLLKNANSFGIPSRPGQDGM